MSPKTVDLNRHFYLIRNKGHFGMHAMKCFHVSCIRKIITNKNEKLMMRIVLNLYYTSKLRHLENFKRHTLPRFTSIHKLKISQPPKHPLGETLYLWCDQISQNLTAKAWAKNHEVQQEVPHPSLDLGIDDDVEEEGCEDVKVCDFTLRSNEFN